MYLSKIRSPRGFFWWQCILKSVGGTISLKKDFLKMCDYLESFKSQIRGGFCGYKNLRKYWQRYFHQERLPQNMWSLQKYKSRIRGGFSGNAIFTVLEVLFPSKKTASKCAISLNHKSHMEGGFGGKMIFTKFWNSNFLQIRLPQKVWSSKRFKSPRGCFSINANLS